MKPYHHPRVLRRPAGVSQVILLTAATLLAAPHLLRAASTGTTALHTPQGSTAGTANGDFVSDTGGMDTFYRYFIEVPSGLSRLQIEIFDADIGQGGATEDTSGRDRDRGNTTPTYNTTATYTLIDPGGTTRATRFNTGSLTLPASSDNAWLDFYNATGNTVGDNFGTAAYTNNNGNNNWAAAWVENDSAGAGAATGSILITGGELRLQDNGATGLPSLEREADLSGTPGLNMAMAFLTFSYRTSGNLEAADQISVQVSATGGAPWTTLETFSDDSTGNRSYDITAFIANNTRVRFVLAGGYDGTEFFFVDNLQISDGPVTAGHWELQVDMGAGDDINAIGLRANDGDATSGGTELNVYFDSFAQFGANPPASGTNTRNYTLYPYLTSGCSAFENDFDYDRNQGNTGSMSFTSRSTNFSQSYASTDLSADNLWHRNGWSGWTSDVDVLDYGIWSTALSITSYGTSGNYTTFYMSNSQAVDPATTNPTTNPTANSFRFYLPTDAGTAPAKPYLEQQLRWSTLGPNPPQVNQTSGYTVTVRLVNPTARSITFSATNVVTANVPGGTVLYAGPTTNQVSQGSVTSQPAANGSGNIIWNPGTVAAGATALMAYQVRVRPTAAGQRNAVTGTPASNGTRAQYVDETGNTTQARATYLGGPLCELAVTQGLLTQAVISSFQTYAAENGGVQVEWTTASEAGTAGFYLSRWDAAAKRFVRVHEGLLPGLIHEDQGGTYRFVDGGASPGSSQTYLLEEVEAGGGRQRFGPYTARPSWERPEGFRSAAETFESEPHPALRRAMADKPDETDQDTGDGLRRAVEAVRIGSADGVHLTVRENGLYYLPSSQIASWFGMTLDDAERTIGKGKFQLTRNGQSAAWYPDFVDSKLKTARGLFFYGETVDSLYSRDTVYHLRQTSGTAMQAVAVPPAAAASGGSFPESQASEVDSFPATAISPDPESDYWFWAFLVADDPTYGHKAFSVDAPGLAPLGAGTLTVNLQGATSTQTVGEHRAAVSLNGSVLGELQWQGIAPKQGTFAVPAGLLLAAGNQVEVTSTVGGGAPYSILYIDGFRLGYPRSFSAATAAGDALAFTPGGNATVTVTGLSGPVVRLVDISNPLLPRWVTGAAVAADPGAPGTYRASFVPSPASRYLATGPAALKTPAAVRAWSTFDLQSTALRADVLIVVPAGFEAAAERLASLRRSQGLESLVVNLNQVADSFGEGIPTPQALKAFIAYARQSWAVPPRYVVLGGEGSLDYRNLQGYGDCALPPLMIQGEGGLFPADNRFADTTGDGLPDLALGRIPVLTPAELDAYVDKILAYESSGTPAWAANALMLADNQDESADFSADSDRIAGLLPPGYDVDRIYLSSTALPSARTELLQGIQSGASWVNYLGHGGLDRLSAGGLLTNSDVATLTNGGRLPVITAMTCTINRFAVPGVPSLGELLVKSPAGGAAAVWGPSGLSYHGEARQLAEAFYRLSLGPNARLGDSVLHALAEYGGLGGDSRMLDIYNLLGDPSLLIRRGPVPALSGGSTGE